MGRFTNKIVVITGGTSGSGLASAKQFANCANRVKKWTEPEHAYNGDFQ